MDIEHLQQSTISRRRLLHALLISLVLHVLLFASIYILLDEVGAELSGESGFDSDAGLQITIGAIEEKQSVVEKVSATRADRLITSESGDSKTNSDLIEREKIEESAGKPTSGKSDTDNFGGELSGAEDYRTEIINILNKHRRYHKVARQRGLEGNNVIWFSVARDGSLLEYKVLESSGERLIDKSAIQMVQDSAPFPEFPEGLDETSIHFEVPLQFSIGK